MSDRFLEQQINIKFCMKLWKNASDSCAVLSIWSGKQTTKFVMETVNIATTQENLHVETTYEDKLTAFFHMKGIVHFEFILQGKTIK